jgi:ATP-binding cassette subfamily C protein LapB
MLLASVALNFASLAVPVLMLHLYDRIIPNSAYATLASLLIGVAAAVMLEAALRHARAALAVRLAAQEEHVLSRAALEQVVRADRRLASAPGDMADGFAAIAEWRSHRTGDLAFTLADLPFALMFLGVLSILSPLLVLTAIAAVLPCLAAAFALGPAAARAIKDRTEAESRRHSLTYEAVAAIEPLKAMGAEAAMLRRHERLVASSAAAGRRTTISVQLCNALANGGSQTVATAIALVGGWLAMHQLLSNGALAAAILLGSRAMDPVARFAAATPMLARARASRNRIIRLLATPTMPHGGHRRVALQEVRLDGLCIARPDGGRLLTNLRFTLRRGDCVLLRGAGGAGKTRLLMAMAGLEPPAEGSVLFDGLPAAQLDEVALRSSIALLSQRPVLLPGRVIDNLTRFDSLMEPEARRLATELGLDAFFERHPAGFAMQVGRGDGQELPPSIVERIALVRALVGQPRLILFDDACAAQDAEGVLRLRRLLAGLRPSVAMMLVTEHPELLALATRQIRIVEGQIQEFLPP